MKSIDFKSLIVGILGTALVAVLLGAASVGTAKYVLTCPSKKDCFLTNTNSGIDKFLDKKSSKMKHGLGDNPDF